MLHFAYKVVHYSCPRRTKEMETSFKRWYEISYQKRVYGPTHTDIKKFYDLKEAYEYADEIEERFPYGQVWIMECTLEKKELK